MSPQLLPAANREEAGIALGPRTPLEQLRPPAMETGQAACSRSCSSESTSAQGTCKCVETPQNGCFPPGESHPSPSSFSWKTEKIISAMSLPGNPHHVPTMCQAHSENRRKRTHCNFLTQSNAPSKTTAPGGGPCTPSRLTDRPWGPRQGARTHGRPGHSQADFVASPAHPAGRWPRPPAALL